MANTRSIHSSSGGVHTGGRLENTCISASSPIVWRSRVISAAWSMPGTVRISTPMVAVSGTMLTPLPPAIVPTFMVGAPITG